MSVPPERRSHVALMVIEQEESGILGIFFCHLGQHSVHLYPDEHHQTYHVEPG